MLGDHGFVEKCLMYEESVRVPCLISWPVEIPAGQRVAAPLGGVDLVPTLLELAGLPVPATMDGRSFAADITAGREPHSAPVFAEIASGEALYRRQHDPEQFAAHVMVRDGEWKYVWNRFDADELYRLDEDPAEMNNLAAAPGSGQSIDRMRRLITRMLGNTGPGLYEWCLREQER
jgi:arylsulfatase A-like enzyme